MTTPNHQDNRRPAPSATLHLKAEQIAPEFNVCRKTILTWYAIGILPASIAVGRVLRFNLDECRAALKKHAEQ